MSVRRECPRCFGLGTTNCDDPQCGDSTWDHACNAGSTCEACNGSGRVMCESEKPKKLFIIVDAFLDRSQQAVQAAHAVAEFCIENPALAQKWKNQNIVLKKAKDLEPWVGDADAIFEEPYWNNRRTAVAAYRHEGYAEVLPFV